MNKDYTVLWIQHMKEVLYICSQILPSLQPDVPPENRLISLYLHLLLTFSATNTWKATKHMEPLKPTLEKLTHNIMGDLVARGHYITLNALIVRGLCRGKTALRGPAISTIITLATRPLVAAEYADKILSLLILHILSVPALIHHLTT